jgi:hypothetical protein
LHARSHVERLSAKYPEHERQNQGNDDARHDRKVKAEALADEMNIAGQTTEGQFRDPWPQESDGKQDDSGNDENALHVLMVLQMPFRIGCGNYYSCVAGDKFDGRGFLPLKSGRKKHGLITFDPTMVGIDSRIRRLFHAERGTDARAKRTRRTGAAD